jgi:hypothetical protein
VVAALLAGACGGGSGNRAASRTSSAPSVAADQVGAEVTEIGPAQGTPLGEYLADRQQALQAASGDRLAVVSLRRYLTERDARAVAGAAPVLVLLAALRGGQQQVVVGDVRTWVDSQKRDAITERQALQQQLQTTDDPDFAATFKADIDRLGKLIQNAQPDSPVVFGFVLRAPAATLQALARNPQVRLVDVGTSARPGPKPTYTGVKPEETAKANDPLYRPV